MIHTAAPHDRLPFPKWLWVIGAGCMVLALLGLLLSFGQTGTGFLVAGLFCIGVTVGALIWVMVHTLTGGAWGWVVRPVAGPAAITVPLAALVLLPALCVAPWVFPWANHAMIEANEHLAHQQAWMRPLFVWIRYGVYIAVFTALALYFWQRARPSRVEPPGVGASRRLASLGLILVAALGSLAGVDWLMTRAVSYESTIFGFIVIVGWAYTGLAVLILRTAGRPDVDADRRNDLGSLLATCALLWAYLSFCQFLVAWMGNIEREAHWYELRGFATRHPNPWRWEALAMLITGFAFPFGMMLFRRIKRDAFWLRLVAAVVLLSRVLDCFWLAGPTDVTGGFGWISVVVALLAVGGFVLLWTPLWYGMVPSTMPVETETPDLDHRLEVTDAA